MMSGICFQMLALKLGRRYMKVRYTILVFTFEYVKIFHDFLKFHK